MITKYKFIIAMVMETDTTTAGDIASCVTIMNFEIKLHFIYSSDSAVPGS